MRKYLLLSFLFSLSFAGAAKGVEAPDHIDVVTDSVELWADSNRLYIRNGEPGTRIVIYSIVGTKVGELELKNANSELPLQLPKGYYIVKVGEAARKIAVK